MKFLLQVFCLVFISSVCVAQSLHDSPDSPVETCETLTGGPTIKKTIKVDAPPLLPPPTNPPEDADGDRYIYFAHGYGGSEASWLRAEDHLSARKLDDLLRIKEVYNEGYVSLAGISAAAANWNDGLIDADVCRTAGVDPTQNIVISHSLGGLVGRYEYNEFASDPARPPEDLLYDGLITFDSPHLGAGFANNLDLVDDFIEEACNNLSKGPALDAATQIRVVFWFQNTTETVEDITSSLCGNVIAPFSNIILELFGIASSPDPNSPSTSNDLKEGSAALQALNDAATVSPTHQIAISSNETQNGLVWRTLYWAALGNTNTSAFGKANCDGPLVAETDNCPSAMEFNTAGKWLTWYRDNQRRLVSEANDISCPFNFFGACANRRQNLRNAGYAYGDGERWLGVADDRFKALAGFTRVITTPGPAGCECLADAPDGIGPQIWYPISGNYQNCSISLCENNLPQGSNVTAARNRDIITIEEYENDGIVSVESQESWGANVWRYDNSNHFQVRNDRTTEDAFRRALLNGDDDDWFRCTR